MKKIKFTWDEFDMYVNSLANQIKSSKIKFDGIYGLPRGGLPFAVSLSHQLNIPLLLKPEPGCLIADDISDTGHALFNYPDHFIVTLFTTTWTKTVPNIAYFNKMRQDDWIVFPWEEFSGPVSLEVLKGGMENE